ncbi:SCO family protein [Mucilaginibacter sp. KACC 22063]|uniref:SCO family protein n=1 Tax=Mucilaginibacter sp. KACC 22063 TaxID=3025666 RepID=UPI002365E8F1|nr:SCO family protein [Mucilaginibacter sp. KACC 22063]WDF53510.1 SCO family protein [Mucilaginibacter sp. KACC 22063]
MKKIFYGLMAVLALSACKFNDTAKQKLPILGNREAVTKVVNGKSVTDTVYQTIPKFAFIDQYGDSVTNKSLDGNIYVADFFFASCPNICPVMHRNMIKVYNTFKDLGDFKIVSYTIDPKHDSVAVLKQYAQKLGVNDKRWLFLQGKKEETYKLAKGYMVEARESVHDGYFILVDKQKRIRGSYLGTDEKEVDKMIADIKVLQAEPEQTIAQ